MTPQRQEYWRSRPFDRREVMDGRAVLFRLGSPRRINEYLHEDRLESVLKDTARVANADVLCVGHTHLPYPKQVDGTLFANPGSVGKPKDTAPRAGYVLAPLGSEVENQIRRVANDVAAAAQAVRESGLPTHVAALLETGGVPSAKTPARPP